VEHLGFKEMTDGYIQTRSGLDGYATPTSVPGVFAAGDVPTVSGKSGGYQGERQNDVDLARFCAFIHLRCAFERPPDFVEFAQAQDRVELLKRPW